MYRLAPETHSVFVVGCATLCSTSGVILFDLSAGPEFSLLQFKLRDSLEMSAIALRLEAHSHLFKLNRRVNAVVKFLNTGGLNFGC